MKHRCGRRGFTLIEVLVALALAGMLAGIVARSLVGARHVSRATSATSDGALARDLGADLLAGDVRRAGYIPSSSASTDAWMAPEAALELSVHPGRPRGDSVTVWYVDDRLAGPPVARQLTFEAATDGRGLPQLYRLTSSGAKQPLVEGVRQVTVSGWVDAGGRHRRAELMQYGTIRPWLLVLRISAGTGPDRTVAVPLTSRPVASVSIAP